MDRDHTLARARSGDAAAFASLVPQHQSMVFSLALHMLRSRPAAEVHFRISREAGQSGISSARHFRTTFRPESTSALPRCHEA